MLPAMEDDNSKNCMASLFIYRLNRVYYGLKCCMS